MKKLNPFSKVSEEIEPLEENSSQSGSGQRTADEKSNGGVSNFWLSKKKYSITFIILLLSKASEEIKPLMEDLSQSDFVQRTAEEKSNGEVSNF